MLFLVSAVAVNGCGKKQGTECDFLSKVPGGRQSSYLIEVRERVDLCGPGHQVASVQKVHQTIEANLSISQQKENVERKMAELVILSATVERTRRNGKGPTSRLVRKLPGVVGARVQWHIDANGRMEKVTGIDSFMKQVISDSQLANGTFATVFSEDFLEKGRISGVAVLPDGPARPGYRWMATDRINFDGIGTFLLRRKLHFEKWETRNERSCARIVWLSEVGKVLDAGIGKDILNRPIQKGEGWGWCLFSPALGTVVEWYEEVRLTTRLDVPDAPRSNSGITQDIQRSIDVKLEGVEDTREGSGRLLADKRVDVSIQRRKVATPDRGGSAKLKVRTGK